MSNNQQPFQKIAIAFGDGIGPEIMESTLQILQEANAKLSFEIIEIGKKIYEQGFEYGISPASWEKIEANKILLKAPITTPQGGGYKSMNVALRKRLGLFDSRLFVYCDKEIIKNTYLVW